MRPYYVIAVLVAATFGGCTSAVEQDVRDNGFIRSGWSVDINDLESEPYTSRAYAIANDTLVSKLHTLNLTRDVLDSISCFIAPQSAGYKIVILSRSRLSREEEEKVRSLVGESLQIGAEKARKITKT